MTDRELLTLAVDKAIAGGWILPVTELPESIVEWAIDPLALNYPKLIFNHDFAKALWGECNDWYEPSTGEYRIPQNGYEHHLQQMVIADDPLAYLGEHI